jgi:hypothetical protein
MAVLSLMQMTSPAVVTADNILMMEEPMIEPYAIIAAFRMTVVCFYVGTRFDVKPSYIGNNIFNNKITQC